MPCPLCGDVCCCESNDQAEELDRSNASPRWLPDAEVSADAARQPEPPPVAELASESSQVADGPMLASEAPLEESSTWRLEVAARLNRYQSRRKPRPPRYPSLRLRFEPEAASVVSDHFSAEQGAASAELEINPQRYPSIMPSVSHHALALDEFANRPGSVESSRPETSRSTGPQMQERTAAITAQPELALEENLQSAIPVVPTTAKIIEFPRSWTPPAASLNELAEPVLVRPRILEAPEIVPPPPALGGIMIEPAAPPAAEKRPGVDNPLRSTPVLRRVCSALIDDLIIILACVLFGGIFWKLAGIRPPRIQLLGLATGLSALFWAAYQYLLVVYAGTTPGLRLARLELTRFDGSPVGRSLRRWRVLASFLSAASLGMGYAWVFLDEDSLCWHDRITHTYFAPKGRKAAPRDLSH
jgi:uncharacterized RDD family membrane protein YckC